MSGGSVSWTRASTPPYDARGLMYRPTAARTRARAARARREAAVVNRWSPWACESGRSAETRGSKSLADAEKQPLASLDNNDDGDSDDHDARTAMTTTTATATITTHGPR